MISRCNKLNRTCTNVWHELFKDSSWYDIDYIFKRTFDRGSLWHIVYNKLTGGK